MAKANYRKIPVDALKPAAAKLYKAMLAAEEAFKLQLARDVAAKEGCEPSEIKISTNYGIAWTEATGGGSTPYRF